MYSRTPRRHPPCRPALLIMYAPCRTQHPQAIVVGYSEVDSNIDAQRHIYSGPRERSRVLEKHGTENNGEVRVTTGLHYSLLERSSLPRDGCAGDRFVDFATLEFRVLCFPVRQNNIVAILRIVLRFEITLVISASKLEEVLIWFS